MQVSVLASGSKGNAVYVELDGTRLLVDAGISAARIKKALAQHDVDLHSIDAILVTHEHIDHVRGLKTLSKQYRLPILATQGTLENIDGGVRVRPFATSHDAADPCGFRLEGSACFTLATDLGVVTDGVQAAIEGADVLVLEANHDPEMLRRGDYPWPLKRRILSDRGHLANSEAAWALMRMKKRPHKVYLAHLSEENNRPPLAHDTVQEILTGNGVLLDVECCLPEGGATTIIEPKEMLL